MSKRYKQNKDVIFREEEDEAILFNPRGQDSPEIVVINSTGRFVWSLLNGKNTQENIAAKVAKEFDVSEKKAAKDLGFFLVDLEKKHFIKN
jgi:hypothetical protein